MWRQDDPVHPHARISEDQYAFDAGGISLGGGTSLHSSVEGTFLAAGSQGFVLDQHYAIDQLFLAGKLGWDAAGNFGRTPDPNAKAASGPKVVGRWQEVDAKGKVVGSATTFSNGVTVYAGLDGVPTMTVQYGPDGREVWARPSGEVFEIDFHTDIIRSPEQTGDSPAHFGSDPDLRLAYGTDTKTGISIDGERKKIPVDGVSRGPVNRTDADTSLWGPSKSDAVPQAQEWEQQNAQDYLNQGKVPTLSLPDGRTPNASEIVPGPPPPSWIEVAPPAPATAAKPQGQSPQGQAPQGSLAAGGQLSGSPAPTWRSVLGDVYRGVFQEGAKEIILGPLEAMIASNPLLAGAVMGYGAHRGYQERGIEGALNSVNPFFELFKSVAQGYNAIEDRDYAGLGQASVRVGKSVAGLAGAAIAGAAAGPGIEAEEVAEEAAADAAEGALTRVTGDALRAARAQFNAVKSKFWQNEAANNPGAWSAEDLIRMGEGKALIGSDGFPMELHHETPLAEGGSNDFSNLTPLTRTAHRLGQNYKRNHPNLP